MFGRCYSPKTGRSYLGTTPSRKRVQRICEAISQETGRDKTLWDPETVVVTLNRMMIGWANYFCLGTRQQSLSGCTTPCPPKAASVGCALSTNDGGPGGNCIPTTSCTRSLVWSGLPSGPPAFRGRTREPFSESWMREMLPSGSMSGVWRRSGAATEASTVRTARSRRRGFVPRRHTSTLPSEPRPPPFGVVV
jgi:hypothetical protein